MAGLRLVNVFVRFVFLSDGAKVAGGKGSGNSGGVGQSEKQVKVEGSGEERQKCPRLQVL